MARSRLRTAPNQRHACALIQISGSRIGEHD